MHIIAVSMKKLQSTESFQKEVILFIGGFSRRSTLALADNN